MTASSSGDRADEQAFLDSVEGEISFFRSIMRARPIGKHRHFHILMVRNAILRDTGRSLHIESLWEKLRKCYNLDALEAIDVEAENYHLSKAHSTSHPIPSTSDSMSPTSFLSPSPSENLSAHPFFREEFSLPYEEFDALIAQRRMRETASLPSSPASPSSGFAAEGVAAPAGAGTVSAAIAGSNSTRRAPASGSAVNANTATRAGKRKLTKSKLNLAGLVGGDSDSSALTQESGDEGGEAEDSGMAETPRGSVFTGTATDGDGDGRTEDGDEEDVEMREVSPAREASPKPTKGRSTKSASDRGRRGRAVATGGSSRGGTTRGKKKQKR